MPDEKQQLQTSLLGRQGTTTILEAQRCVEIVGVYWQTATGSESAGWAVLLLDSDGNVHDAWLRRVHVD